MHSDSLGSSPEHAIVIWAVSVLNVVTMTGFQPLVNHNFNSESNVYLLGKVIEKWIPGSVAAFRDVKNRPILWHVNIGPIEIYFVVFWINLISFL